VNLDGLVAREDPSWPERQISLRGTRGKSSQQLLQNQQNPFPQTSPLPKNRLAVGNLEQIVNFSLPFTTGQNRVFIYREIELLNIEKPGKLYYFGDKIGTLNLDLISKLSEPILLPKPPKIEL